MAVISSLLAIAHERAHTTPGVPPAPSPILVRNYYDTAVESIVGLMGLLWQEWKSDIAEDEASYCLPNLDRIESAWVLDSGNKKRPLGFAHSRDAALSVAYGDTPAEGVPNTLIVEGMGRLRLHPRPNYAKEEGLIVTGYGTYDRTLYSLSSECPLKLALHEQALVASVALNIAQHIKDADNVSLLSAEVRDLMARVEINARDYTPDTAMQRGTMVASIDNPLNPMGW